MSLIIKKGTQGHTKNA